MLPGFQVATEDLDQYSIPGVHSGVPETFCGVPSLV
jgi:hypothetical protein